MQKNTKQKSAVARRKILSLLLSLAMILTALPLTGVTAFAEDETHTSGYFKYTVLEDGTAEITGYNGKAETLEIPSKLDGYTVTSIGYEAFKDCDSLTSVTIPDSVESISEDVFGYCNGLTEIKVDGNNKNYSSQDGVLFDKNKTELIKYPSGNTRASYDIPKSVTSICNSAFIRSNSLTNITIPEGVTTIGESAFFNCYSLTSVTIPKSVTSIGLGAFYDCYDLTDIYILNSECYLNNDYWDYDCPETIPSQTTIHGYADSTAEEYSKKFDNKFVVMSGDPANPDAPVPSGDVNVDGNLSTVDAKWILQNIAGSRDFTEAQFKAADLNGDGKVTTVDAKWVLQAVAGMRTV